MTVASSDRRRRRANKAPARWASVNETAAYIGVTTRTLRAMVADGRLTQYHLGTRVVRFDLNEVDTAIKRGGA